jgi:acyl transferase domain-containing protein
MDQPGRLDPALPGPLPRSALIAESLDAAGDTTGADAMVRKDCPEPDTAVTAAAGLFVAGAEIDWPAVLSGTAAARMELPTYAFQRRPYSLSR